MRVSPRELKAVRAGGMVTRYAVLGAAMFVIAELPEAGTAGTTVEAPCRKEHWLLVLQGEIELDGGRARTFPAGTAFHVAPGPVHRLRTHSRAVVAGFQPVTTPIDDSPEVLRDRGMQVLRRVSAPVLPPTSMRVAGAHTRTATVGQIQTESAVMGDWLFTRTTFGPKTGFADGWCDLPHWGFVLDGNLVLHWENGEIELLGPGDVYHCPDTLGHRIEVADTATIVDYTPIAAVDEPSRRRAPRALAARTGVSSPGPAEPGPIDPGPAARPDDDRPSATRDGDRASVG